MNPKLFSIALLGAATLTVPVYADDENKAFDRLPPAVQATVKAANIDGPVKDVTTLTIEGETVYVIEFEQDNAVNPRLRVAADGSLVGAPDAAETPPDRRAGTGAPVVGPAVGIPVGNNAVQMQSLPEAVQQTVRREAGDRQIADIDEEKRDGRTVYEVEFSEPGLNPQIHVAADGQLIKREDAGASLRAWLPGLQLEDTPEPVQQAVQKHAGDRKIADVDRKERDGTELYEVDVGEDDDRFSLEIARDGQVLRDSRRENVRGVAE